MTSFKECCQKVPVSALPKPDEVLIISSSDSFEEAFGKLVAKNVLSAPVFDEKEKKYVGFLDMRDLVSIVVAMSEPDLAPTSEALQTIDELLRLSRQHFKYAADGPTVTYMARRNPFVAVKAKDATLYDVLEALDGKRPGRVHRVPIVDEAGKVVNIVSQMSVIGYIAANAAHVLAGTGAASKSLKELQLGTYPALTVSESAVTRDVFKLLDKHQRSGVAIVNGSGQLVGNISGRDLKQFITRPELSKLKLSIRDFLADIRSEQIDIMAPAIAVDAATTLSKAMDKLAATRVHRLYVVDGDKSFKPVGVVALTDIVKFLMKK